MTYLLSADPGKNSGLAMGYYDSLTPYRLLERWQVHGGLEGFLDWVRTTDAMWDEMVVERFDLANNDFVADITPKAIEGSIVTLREYDPRFDCPIIWQTRQDKASLIGYPPEADTPDKRQRLRSKFLDRFGMFTPGEDNQDSMDAIVHSIVSLKRRKHAATLLAYFPPTKFRI